MTLQSPPDPSSRPLRILCIEDNALLVIYLQSVIEDAGHVFAGSAARFEDVKASFGDLDFDLALVDIDLADGRTGGVIAQWLRDLGKSSFFITGQDQLAAEYGDVSLGTIQKPVSEDRLVEALQGFWARQPGG